MDIPKLVITGGPCAGKTTGLNVISERLANRGYHPLVIPEAPTLLMLANATPKVYAEKVFQRGVVKTMRNQEDTVHEIGLSRPELNPVIICDRGIADCPPYMQQGVYEEILEEIGLGSPVEVRDGRYKGVFHLRSVAYDRPALYTTANNKARRESVEEARERDEQTLAAWTGHPHLRVIDNSTDLEGKLRRLDKEICALLGIPVPLEIERKYLCAPVRFEDLPSPCQRIEIEQVYLLSVPGRELRVRRRGQHGQWVYFRTEKHAARHGERVEVEERITAADYAFAMKFADPRCCPIRKERWCFVWKNQYFELDRIARDGSPLHLLELELTNLQQEVKLPPFVTILEDVTHDPAYSNYELSKAA
jgi:CYTH domain-containing protein/predicted ATPase